MKLSKPVLFRALRIAGGFLAVLIAIILVLSIFRVSIPLAFLRPKVEAAASQALGRDFRMDNAPRIVIGLRPTFKIEGCSIGNPAGWASDRPFAQLDRFFIKLGLSPLLRKDIRIDDLEISGLQLNLEKTASGEKNWIFGTPDAAENSDAPESTEGSGGGFSFGELRRLSIQDVGMKSFGPGGEKKVLLAFNSVEGHAASGEGMDLDLTGTFQEKPFHGKLSGGTLEELIDRKPWPYEFAGELAGASVALAGNLGSRELTTAAEHDFKIDAPDIARLEQFTGPLPRFGDVHLAGKLRFTADGFAMPELNGNLGTTAVNGDLDVNTTGEISRVSGHLDLGSIDMAIFKKPEDAAAGEAATAASEEKETEPVEEAAGENETSSDEPGRLSQIKKEGVLPFVGEVRLTIAAVVNQKVKVEALNLGVRIEEEFVTADVSVDFADAPLRGDLEIRKHDREENPITLDLDLEAKNADIGELMVFYTDASGFTGLFDSLRYTIQGAGSDLAEAWTQKQIGLEVINAAMSYQGEEKATEFQLDRGFIDGAWNRETRMGADGVFLGEVFSIKFNKLKSERSAAAGRPPFLEFSGTASGATFRMAGDTRLAETDPKLPLDLEVSGESLGGLHNWVGIPKEANLSYGAKGTILFENGWRLNLAEGNLGQTTLAGEIGVSKSEEKSAYLAKLSVGTLDFGELGVLFGKGSEEGDEESGFDLDTNLLPAGVHVDDADVDLKIEKLVFGSGEIGNLALAATIREGWVEKAPFDFSFNGTDFAGGVAFDFRKDQPKAGLELKAESVNIGRVLEQLGVTEGLEAQAGKLGLRVHARGRTLREILVESDLDVDFSEALWVIADPNTGAKLPISIASGSIGGKRGENTVVKLDGKVAETPLKLEIRTDGIDALLNEDEQINLALDAEIAGSRIGLEGKALLPLDRADLDANLTWTGEKLSDLDGLLKVDLPPVGPVSVKGRIRVVEEGYSLSGLDLLVGETDLKGNLSVKTTGKRPSLSVDLSANRFQIDDFAVEGWTPKSGSKDDKQNLAQRVVAGGGKLAKLASAEFLGSLDAKISLKAADVRSGQDTLGSGSITALLKDGSFDIAPLNVAIPGGEFLANFHYYPRAKTYDWELNLKSDRFDYGVLARRKDPKTDMTGFLNVDVALKNTDAPLEDFVLAHSTGHVNFEVCPETMRAGVFDFWGANFLFAILPKIDPGRTSEVNCIIGRMKIADGLMTPEALGIDTTRVRVITEGTINFQKEEIDLLLVPRPKKPEFLRAGTKLTASGTFDDFDIATGPMPILRSLARMAGSTVLFPGNLLFQERIPEDGSDICSCDKR